MNQQECPACGAIIDGAPAVCPRCGRPLAVPGAEQLAGAQGDLLLAPAVPLRGESGGRLILRAAARTHPGRVRASNEDSVLFIQLTGQLAGASLAEPGFFAVADGMGGHDQGEVASRRVLQHLAAAVLDRVFKRVALTGRGADQIWMERTLRDCILAANGELMALQRASRSDMGTTLTAALVIDGQAVVANVGDSRTYLWRASELRQITRDHSLVASLVAAGQLAPEAVYTHDQKAMIYRSIGESDNLAVDMFSLTLQPHDRLLLCSDGLWEMVRDEGVTEALGATAEPQETCDRLVAAANSAGGEDNISVLTVWAAPAAE